MSIKKHIPNFLTCCNLLCGCMGLLNAFYSGSYQMLAISSVLIFLACLFDFLDGFVARLLKVSSPIGKELDSLADVVTFGVLPGVIVFKLLESIVVPGWNSQIGNIFFNYGSNIRYGVLPLPSVQDFSLFKYHPYIEMTAFIIPIFSALRLAKFNIDTRQSDSFIGVPTPANAILIASLPLILANPDMNFLKNIILNPYFLIALTFIMSFLLVAELPLFALKFKSFKWTDNKIRYSFLLSSIVIFVFMGWAAIPLIIFLYVGLSFVDNKFINPKKTQTF